MSGRRPTLRPLGPQTIFFGASTIVLCFIHIGLHYRLFNSNYLTNDWNEMTLLSPISVTDPTKEFRVHLMDKVIGTGRRICKHRPDQELSIKQPDCLMTIHGHDSDNVNGPMPLRVRPWMAKVYQTSSVLVYVSSHTSFNIRTIEAKFESSTDQFIVNSLKEHNSAVLSFDSNPCKSLHSPAIAVDDQDQMLYM